MRAVRAAVLAGGYHGNEGGPVLRSQMRICLVNVLGTSERESDGREVRAVIPSAHHFSTPSSQHDHPA